LLSPGWPFSPDPVDAATMLPLDLGSGLVLRLTTEGDAADAYAVIDSERARLREWLPWVDATSSLSVERDFLRGIEAVNGAGAGLHTTIRIAGEFSGFVGMRLDAVHRTAEVGYWLSDRAVGRGVMTRSVAAMCDLAFGPLAMHRVELLAATGNQRSRAIAERLGMSLEGVRREAEELATGYVDLAMYAVLAGDWPGAPAALARIDLFGP
jgi:ribosomal-protein-serine acetyltransferase